MFKVSVPISVPVSKNKKFYLNLNQYRNAHHHTLAKAKVNYHEIVEPLLAHLPRFHRIELHYTLFTGTNQLCDVSNICTIVDKFFSDSLVTCGKIEDDNRQFVPSVRYCYGGVDKFNPRVEVTIEPVRDDSTEEEDMQIIIIQAEIEEAIEKHIREQIVVKDDHRIDIELRATRGSDGYQAIIDIVPATADRKVRDDSEGSVQASVKVAKATPAATAPKAPAKPKADKVQPPAAAVPAAEAEATVSEPVAEVQEEAPFDTAEDVQAEAVDVAAEQEEVAPAPAKRPSLFGNMTAPVNS